MQARATYEQGRDSSTVALGSFETRSRALGAARLIVVAGICVLIGAIVWARFGLGAWIGVGALVSTFIVLVFVHARVHDQAQRAAARLRFHKRGLARLDFAWAELPAATARFSTADHAFANDLDVFGRASLMQLIDATETVFGETRLAQLLSQEDPAGFPQTVADRQEAVKDLAKRHAFRETLATEGAVLNDEKPDPSALITWAEENSASPAFSAWLAWLLPALVAIAMVWASLTDRAAGAITLIAAVAIAVGIVAGGRFTRMLEAVSSGTSSVTRWRAMIAAIEREPVEAPALRELRAKLEGQRARASDEIRRLERIVGFADARRNEVFRFFIGPVLMWDAHCALALLRWRARAGPLLRVWLETLGEVEALASLAGLAFERPHFVWPELTAEPRFEARGLGHPLIEDGRRVGNDVSFSGAGHALVVTGSNMSGKSTLLRALGTNAVLANAGAPVCAQALRLGPLRVATSMRIEDSLERGVSHFYAELRRIKRVIDLAREPKPASVFFLLDEILHGTNSRERIIGACAVVEALVSLGALGAVSTHDLGITALERRLPGRIENAHFEEQVKGDTMTFDYVLRPGIVQSSNALRLMRAVGIDVAADAEHP